MVYCFCVVKRLCVREAREWDSSDLNLFFPFKKWANPAPTRATESKAPPRETERDEGGRKRRRRRIRKRGGYGGFSLGRKKKKMSKKNEEGIKSLRYTYIYPSCVCVSYPVLSVFLCSFLIFFVVLCEINLRIWCTSICP